MAIWIFVTLIQPLVFIVVWRTVAGSGETGGYTANQFVAYFLVMMLVDHLTFIWIMWEFEWRIRTGAFSPLLMRPIHPIHGDVCENLAYKTLGLVGVLPAAVLLGVAFDADLSGVTVLTVLPFLIALVLAMVLRFVVEWCLALAAFWLTKVTAINSLFFALTSFFGGVFAPLAVLPVWMQTVAVWTPFPWSLAFPVEVAPGPADRRRTSGSGTRPSSAGSRWPSAAWRCCGGGPPGGTRRSGHEARTAGAAGVPVARRAQPAAVPLRLRHLAAERGDRPGHPGAGALGGLLRHRRPAAAGDRTTCSCSSASTSSSPG